MVCCCCCCSISMSAGYLNELKRKREDLLFAVQEGLYKSYADNAINDNANCEIDDTPVNNNDIDGRKRQRYNVDSFEEKELKVEEMIESGEGSLERTGKVKGSWFLLTVNTNKKEARIDDELFLNSESGALSLEEFKTEFYDHVRDYLLKREHFIPKLFMRPRLPPDIEEQIREMIMDIKITSMEWELSSLKNGEKLHIHTGIEVLYASEFKGFFHIDVATLRRSIRTTFTSINWGRGGPHINARFCKGPRMQIRTYIEKLRADENKGLVEKTLERINEYHKFREERDKALIEEKISERYGKSVLPMDD